MNLRELVGILGHELRTPLAAILGYQELLIDGIYGDIDERQREPLERIMHSSTQLLHLIDGLQELVDRAAGGIDEHVPTSTGALLAQVLATAKPYAAGRNVQLLADHEDQPLESIALSRFLRAADLALVAAIKASPGLALNLALAPHDGQLVFTVRGTELSLADDPNQPATLERPLSAIRLRLSMACAAAHVVGGTVELAPEADATTVIVRIPAATP